MAVFVLICDDAPGRWPRASGRAMMRETAPRSAIVVLSGFEESGEAEECMERDARAYVSRGEPMEKLRATVRRVAGVR